jgi:hypothetical protein
MKLDRRQKILIPLIVIAFIYIGWQVYEIFFVGKGVPVPTTSQKITLAKPVATKLALPQQPKVPAVVTQQQQDVPEKKTISDISVPSGQSEAYLKLMKEYQSLEAQRMLLQEKVAIAEMKQKISELNAKLAQLPSVETGIPKTVEGQPEYKLIYLDHQQRQWTATLADKNNVFREVNAGSELADGYKVISVTSRGVVMAKDGKVMRLTFAGVVPLHVAPKPVIKRPVLMPGPVILPKPKTTVKKPLVKPMLKIPQKPISQLQPMKPKVSAVTKPAPVPIVPNYTLKPVTPNYKLEKIPPVKKKPAKVTTTKAQKVVTPAKPETTNTHAVITQLVPQRPPSEEPAAATTQDNNSPIIMMN